MKTYSPHKNRRAQILVEYLLLMVIAVGAATLLTNTLISRKASGPGIIITAWDKILKNVGKDLPDCEKPNCQQ